MDNYDKLIKIIERDFNEIDPPYDILANRSDNSFNASIVRKEFEMISRDKMTIFEAKSLLMKGPVISDETIIYYLPVLVKTIIGNRDDYDLLLWRLESVNVNLLNDRQLKTMNILTRALHDLELMSDMEDTLNSLVKIRQDQIN